MKNYSELTDTDLTVTLSFTCVGNPDYTVTVNGVEYRNPTTVTQAVNNLTPFTISVELTSKDYAGPETAVVINSIAVDGIALIPKYEYLAHYVNDHNDTNPTNYLGYVGRWTLVIDCPFYQWLHRVTNQGWLLTV